MLKINRLLALVAIMVALAGALFTQVKPAGAYVGQVWDTRQIYYGQVGRGGEADYVLYPARSGHMRLWFRYKYNSGSWFAEDGPIATCAGSVSCWNNIQLPPYMGDKTLWIPDHFDLIANDYYYGAGGYIIDAGPL